RFIIENHKEILVSHTLKDFEAALESCGFIRTHQSHLVNLNHIQTLVKRDGGYLKMSDGSSVPISRSRKEELSRRII
ncbi:MAG: LytTR family DNA-binding domain-containing protein, partial [Bacteroidia bacterium]|nr:LytTR family DNA-binding domain-containing protein [Bacteroidia bacterium]